MSLVFTNRRVEAPRGKVERDTGKKVERGGGGADHAASGSTLGRGFRGVGVGVPRAALPGVLLEMRELAERFLTEVTTVGLGP